MKNKSLCGVYFCGNEASPYAQEHGYLDYRTLSKAFDGVLSNDIIARTNGILGYWEPYSGEDCYYIDDNGDEIGRDEFDENGGDCIYYDVYQYIIISDAGARLLAEWTNEIVWYNDELDMYVWGVTHWGTPWDYVLTNIRLNVPYEEQEC